MIVQNHSLTRAKDAFDKPKVLYSCSFQSLLIVAKLVIYNNAVLYFTLIDTDKLTYIFQNSELVFAQKPLFRPIVSMAMCYNGSNLMKLYIFFIGNEKVG